MHMENGYGIGALDYCRRVLETEIKKIVDNIAETSEDRKQKINQLKEKYKESRQLSHLYDEIYPFLPSSLKELGNNPISFLYQKL